MKLSNVSFFCGWANSIKEKALPAKTAFRLAKLLSQYEKDYETYNKIVAEHLNNAAKHDENGRIVQSENGGIVIDDDKFKEFRVQIQGLEGQEVEEPNKIFKFDSDDLKQLGDFTASDMLGLLPFIREDE